ncbi:MAG: hypothetical protein AABY89_03535, partial [Acidobacteriota bacterium]
VGPRISFPTLKLVDGGERLASTLFGTPIGTLVPGTAADLVVCDYVAPTPIQGSNVAWHLLAGLQPAMINKVMVGGRWVYRDGRVAGVDMQEVYAKARRVAASLWTRMRG